jgi:hypothetical protein
MGHAFISDVALALWRSAGFNCRTQPGPNNPMADNDFVGLGRAELPGRVRSMGQVSMDRSFDSIRDRYDLIAITLGQLRSRERIHILAKSAT